MTNDTRETRMEGELSTNHVFLLIGSFAGLFYSFGLAMGGWFHLNSVGDGLAGIAACLILLGTVFLLDPDRPLLDAGSQP